MNHILTHDYGKSFPPAMSFAGYVIAFVGLFTSFNSMILGIIFLLVGIFIGFTRSGIQLNLLDKTYRSYTSIFGLKHGKWKSIKEFKCLSLLKNQVETAAYSRSNRRAITSNNIYYEINLLNASHRNKLSIKREKDKERAISSLKELSIQLDLPIKKYRPQRNADSFKQQLTTK